MSAAERERKKIGACGRRGVGVGARGGRCRGGLAPVSGPEAAAAGDAEGMPDAAATPGPAKRAASVRGRRISAGDGRDAGGAGAAVDDERPTLTLTMDAVANRRRQRLLPVPPHPPHPQPA